MTFQNKNFHSEHTQSSYLDLLREKCLSPAACLLVGARGRACAHGQAHVPQEVSN